MPPSHVALRLLIEGGEPATREVDGSAEAVQTVYVNGGQTERMDGVTAVLAKAAKAASR